MIIEYYDYREYILSIYPEISRERRDTLKTFNKGLNLLVERHKEDEYTQRGLILPKNVMRGNGCRPETFHRMNNTYPMIECVNSHYSYKWGVAKIYGPTDNYIKMLSLAAEYGVKKLYAIDGKDVKNISYSVDYTHTCNISTDRLGWLSEYYDRLGDDLKQRQCLKMSAATDNGVLTQHYIRKDCMRLFAMGTSLQNASSEIRDTLLEGCYRYDASNCHFAICARYSRDEFIQEYARHPDLVRETIADAVGISPKEVKLALIKILYGADTGYMHNKKALANDLGKERAERFLRDEQVRGIMKGIDDVARRIMNKFGKIPGKKVHETLAHHLMTIESQMLDACIELCPDVKGLYFDGFVSGVKMNVFEMQVAVFKKTDVVINFTEEVIEIA